MNWVALGLMLVTGAPIGPLGRPRDGELFEGRLIVLKNPTPGVRVIVLGRSRADLHAYNEGASGHENEPDGGIAALGLKGRCIAVQNASRGAFFRKGEFDPNYGPTCRVRVFVGDNNEDGWTSLNFVYVER